jgi:predicted DNA-binding protein (UPF0278 family)
MKTAKERLIAKCEEMAQELRKDSKVYRQMNYSSLLDTIEQIQSLNLVQAHKLEGAICAAEDRCKRSAAKYGWGFSPISPLDYCGFIEA